MIIGMTVKYRLIGINQNINRRNWQINPFCTSSFKFYIKDEDISCHWVGHSKMKPIDFDKLFKRKSKNDENDYEIKVISTQVNQ